MDIHQQIQIAYPQAFSVIQGIINDWALAEDSLQDAVESALQNWPKSPPVSPVAWLVTAAKNKAIDHYRHHQRFDDDNDAHAKLDAMIVEDNDFELTITDDVLRLIFCCCHPYLERETQIALTLKHVAGFRTQEIANALLVSEKTMDQRLTRAKKRLSRLNLAFELPGSNDIRDRLDSVLQVIYLIYNEGYCATVGDTQVRQELCKEAIRLTRWLHTLVRRKPNVPYAELLGLLALMMSQQARVPSRTNHNGDLILLAEQDRDLWNDGLIQESQILIEKALKMGDVGCYQIQAAISVLHNQAKCYAQTDWTQIRLLYEALLRKQDTPVIRLNYGVALANEFGPEHGLNFIQTLADELQHYLPFHAAVAALSKELGQHELTRNAYLCALNLAGNEQIRRYYKDELKNLEST